MLVLGTLNRKKAQELIGLLELQGVQIITLADFPAVHPVEEDGHHFVENARKKASGYARQIGQWVLADDSGLVVEALGGRPGVHSARYAGPEADDAANRRKLLAELAGTPLEQRTARFECHLALADPRGVIQAEAHGQCRGRICFAERGEKGFGYDPLFEIVEYHRTFGELGPVAKGRLSHRGRAIEQIRPILQRLLQTLQDG
ncbi:MAG: RdgB/HAM1 family non-canonical purine NTP pyrophosphatase [Thermoguttaceae bacterium]|nr:RdgB/HAM1 family non-canonical purine NTP pyrophosphatase [Thermoguttaceae bacterium]MDW8036461.1 RdgB/HAM1 family non-canonical purine NTP pyrophosphatase [Thermoguttaceae bacterium]